MMMEQEELILELPLETVKNTCGFSIDIGGSAVKVVYIRKDDWEKHLKEKQATDKVKIRMRIYAKDRLEEALHFLRINSHIARQEDRLTVANTSGTGCYQNADVIKKILDVKVEVIWELDVIVDAIFFLTRLLPRDQFEYLPSDDEKLELLNVMKRAQQLDVAICGQAGSKQWKSDVESLDLNMAFDQGIDPNLPIAETIDDMYPWLLFGLHTASGYAVIKSKDDFGMASPINNGGASFLGIGSIICGRTKTYDELIDMAEKGDYKNVDQTYASLLVKGDDQDNVYSNAAESEGGHETLYGFGKAAILPPEEFKKEDIIACLLQMLLREHVDKLIVQMLINGTRRVFINGSFCRRPLVRKMILTEFFRQKVVYAGHKKGKILNAQIHFVKSSPFLGCIGALFRDEISNLASEKI